MTAGAAAPVGAAEFASLLDRLGPFEPQPHLALAVSGGADSTALALLAHDWARARGGQATALIVDHRLRPESTAEAAGVAASLSLRGIPAEILTWDGPRPTGDVQAAAREARYRLLGDWCRARGVLHLLTAHHREDQAETLLLRLARGSGLAGLAGMAPLVEAGACRLLRPLLGLSTARLRATLGACGQSWVEDPSNRNPHFARARLRAAGPDLAALGLDGDRLAETARHLAWSRVALEQASERLLAEAVVLHPAGFARLDPAFFARAPRDPALRALAAVLAMVGGTVYPPRFDRLERLFVLLAESGIAGLAGGRTLGGCRIVAERDKVLIYREAAATAGPAMLEPGASLLWDGRFHVTSQASHPIEISALGSTGARVYRAAAAPDRLKRLARHLPYRVWPSLPVLRGDVTLESVPLLDEVQKGHSFVAIVRFYPVRPLRGSGFTVV
jgi:tRNA(Ile)-lysidine synthase